MKCPNCGLEMVIYQVTKNEKGEREVTYACRNQRCPAFDKRLKKATASKEQA